jgi:hypothetical protein
MTLKMTPEEKAKQLVDKMYETEYCGIKHFPHNGYCDCNEMNYFQAKQCAIFSVDNLIEFLVDASNGEFTYIYEVEYWQSVKQEINKL